MAKLETQEFLFIQRSREASPWGFQEDEASQVKIASGKAKTVMSCKLFRRRYAFSLSGEASLPLGQSYALASQARLTCLSGEAKFKHFLTEVRP